jgi:hypothetical protein
VGRGVGAATANFGALSVSATGNGIGAGQATTTNITDVGASGVGRGLGAAITEPEIKSTASGIGNGFGKATPPFGRKASASGVGRGLGEAVESRSRQSKARGIGRGFGAAQNSLPFDPVQEITRLIQRTDNSRWQKGKPDRIDPIWEYSHNDRINFPGSAFYIYTPTDSVVDKFGIEGESFNQTLTIEILIMTLDPTDTQNYINDTATFLSQLFNDNTNISRSFHRFGNISASDLRNEHITQQTDHYIATVSFEIQRFGDVESLDSL